MATNSVQSNLVSSSEIAKGEFKDGTPMSCVSDEIIILPTPSKPKPLVITIDDDEVLSSGHISKKTRVENGVKLKVIQKSSENKEAWKVRNANEVAVESKTRSKEKSEHAPQNSAKLGSLNHAANLPSAENNSNNISSNQNLSNFYSNNYETQGPVQYPFPRLSGIHAPNNPFVHKPPFNNLSVGQQFYHFSSNNNICSRQDNHYSPNDNISPSPSQINTNPTDKDANISPSLSQVSANPVDKDANISLSSQVSTNPADKNAIFLSSVQMDSNRASNGEFQESSMCTNITDKRESSSQLPSEQHNKFLSASVNSGKSKVTSQLHTKSCSDLCQSSASVNQNVIALHLHIEPSSDFRRLREYVAYIDKNDSTYPPSSSIVNVNKSINTQSSIQHYIKPSGDINQSSAFANTDKSVNISQTLSKCHTNPSSDFNQSPAVVDTDKNISSFQLFSMHQTRPTADFNLSLTSDANTNEHFSTSSYKNASVPQLSSQSLSSLSRDQSLTPDHNDDNASTHLLPSQQYASSLNFYQSSSIVNTNKNCSISQISSQLHSRLSSDLVQQTSAFYFDKNVNTSLLSSQQISSLSIDLNRPPILNFVEGNNTSQSNFHCNTNSDTNFKKSSASSLNTKTDVSIMHSSFSQVLNETNSKIVEEGLKQSLNSSDDFNVVKRVNDQNASHSDVTSMEQGTEKDTNDLFIVDKHPSSLSNSVDSFTEGKKISFSLKSKNCTENANQQFSRYFQPNKNIFEEVASKEISVTNQSVTAKPGVSTSLVLKEKNYSHAAKQSKTLSRDNSVQGYRKNAVNHTNTSTKRKHSVDVSPISRKRKTPESSRYFSPRYFYRTKQRYDNIRSFKSNKVAKQKVSNNGSSSRKPYTNYRSRVITSSLHVVDKAAPHSGKTTTSSSVAHSTHTQCKSQTNSIVPTTSLTAVNRKRKRRKTRFASVIPAENPSKNAAENIAFHQLSSSSNGVFVNQAKETTSNLPHNSNILCSKDGSTNAALSIQRILDTNYNQLRASAKGIYRSEVSETTNITNSTIESVVNNPAQNINREVDNSMLNNINSSIETVSNNETENCMNQTNMDSVVSSNNILGLETLNNCFSSLSSSLSKTKYQTLSPSDGKRNFDIRKFVSQPPEVTFPSHLNLLIDEHQKLTSEEEIANQNLLKIQYKMDEFITLLKTLQNFEMDILKKDGDLKRRKSVIEKLMKTCHRVIDNVCLN